MSDVRVTPLEPSAFGVEVEEGGAVTGHRVIVPPSFWDDRGMIDIDDEMAVRESVQFLLDRQPGTAIPPEVSLDDLARDYPDFEEELRTRLAV